MSRFSSLLSRIGWPSCDDSDPVELIAFTSCFSGHGVSTVASQVAVASVNLRKVRTLIVDWNFEKPVLHRRFEVTPPAEFAAAIEQPEGFRNSVCPTEVENLCLLPLGIVGPGAIPAAETIYAAIKLLLEDFDLLVFDMPANETDRRGFCPLELMDRTVLVLDANEVKSLQVQAYTQRLQQRGVKNLSIVMNRVEHDRKVSWGGK